MYILKIKNNSMSYFTNVKINSHYGTYAWCGIGYDGEKPGWHLTDCRKKLTKGVDYSDRKLIITIDVEMSDDLFEGINIINIYDETGFLAQYSKKITESTYHFNFKMEEAMIGTKLKINYDKMLPNPNTRTLSRPPMQTIHQDIITIPAFDIKGDTICAVCLEDVTTEKYISPCHHIFHTNCIWDYLEKNNLIKAMNELCDKHCGHTHKPKKFPCPTCRTII